MPKRRIDPSNPEIIAQMEASIRAMTPDEAYAFLSYRTPGIEETDMVGMFADRPAPKRTARAKRSAVRA